MRRILRKVASGEFNNLGDTSTLADPSVVDDLIKNKRDLKILTNKQLSQSPKKLLLNSY